MFIICQDYILQKSIDLIKENSFTLKKTRRRQYLAETIRYTDYIDNLVFLANKPAKAKSLLNSLEQAAGGIGLYVNKKKPLKLGDKFTYLGRNIN